VYIVVGEDVCRQGSHVRNGSITEQHGVETFGDGERDVVYAVAPVGLIDDVGWWRINGDSGAARITAAGVNDIDSGDGAVGDECLGYGSGAGVIGDMDCRCSYVACATIGDGKPNDEAINN